MLFVTTVMLKWQDETRGGKTEQKSVKRGVRWQSEFWHCFKQQGGTEQESQRCVAEASTLRREERTPLSASLLWCLREKKSWYESVTRTTDVLLAIHFTFFYLLNLPTTHKVVSSLHLCSSCALLQCKQGQLGGKVMGQEGKMGLWPSPRDANPHPKMTSPPSCMANEQVSTVLQRLSEVQCNNVQMARTQVSFEWRL